MKRVQFPDGTVVTGFGLAEHREGHFQPDYGLYLDERWSPTWNADCINWPDFGLPRDFEIAVDLIQRAFRRAQEGQRVEVNCLGGRGRTGTVLSVHGGLGRRARR